MTDLVETRVETRDLTYRDGRSDKFWSITLEGQTHTVRFGRSGTAGQSQQKSFPTAAAARASMEKLVAEKLRKGYVESAGAPAPARRALSSRAQRGTCGSSRRLWADPRMLRCAQHDRGAPGGPGVAP